MALRPGGGLGDFETRVLTGPAREVRVVGAADEGDGLDDASEVRTPSPPKVRTFQAAASSDRQDDDSTQLLPLAGQGGG